VWRSLGACVVVSLVLLAAAELGVRAISANLPAQTLDDRYEIVHKADQIAAIEQQGGASLVFLGSSPVDAGIDPAVFEQQAATPWQSYNAALLGSPVYLQERWLEDVVLPDLEPTVAVVGVSPLDVVQGANPLDEDGRTLTGSEQRLVENLVASRFRVLDEGLPAQLDRSVSKWSELVRYRATLRTPSVVLDATSETVQGHARPGETRPEDFWRQNTSEQGAALQYRAAGGPRTDGFIELLLDRSLRTPVLPERVTAALEILDDHHVESVVLIPPVDLQAAAVRGLDIGLYTDAAAEIVAASIEHGSPVIDLSSQTYATTDFNDALHLNAAGSQRASTEVASQLDALCASAQLRCP
jgi:hypothetical protein